MKNVALNTNCYGCGVCSIACPTDAIKINLNEEGFYSPLVDANMCVNCGQCLSICSFSNKGIVSDSIKLQSYAAWSLNETIRMESSSGGVTTEILTYLLTNGYRVCTVRYDVKQHIAEHYLAESLDQLGASRGSKYIQSYTLPGLSLLDFSKKYVVMGTPCMIDSLKRLVIKKKAIDNFIFLDFFCHGVPSYYLWEKYVKLIESKCGNIQSVVFRYKDTGWQDSLKLYVKGANYEYKGGINQGDVFYRLFLGDYCLGKACYHHCKFKMDKSSADIRVGDLWGKTYKNSKEGVSAVVALTDKGRKILRGIQGLMLQEESFNVVSEGQMPKPPVEPLIRKILIKSFIRRADNFNKEMCLVNCYEILKKIKKIITQPSVVIKNRLDLR